MDNDNASLRLLYSSLARKYEVAKEEWRVVSRQCEEVKAREGEANATTEKWQEQAVRYKASLEEVVNERNKYKGQCTQAIRQWDQALRERTLLQEKLAKVEKEKEELAKEVEQAMNIRIKASKDIKRLTEERNSALHEYSVIMGERGSVIRELDRLQEELATSKKESKDCQLLQREITAALADRDKTMKEVHELRRKLGMVESGDAEFDNLNDALQAVASLRAKVQLLEGKLKDAALEADVAKGRRDWAFAERDKIMLESESVHNLIDQMRAERDRALTKLADSMSQEVTRKASSSQEEMVVEQLEKDCLVKQGEVHLNLDEHKGHGIILGEGVYVRALRPDSVAARSGRLVLGDRILAVNGTELSQGVKEARQLIVQSEKNLVLKTESLTCRSMSRAVERSASQSTPDRRILAPVTQNTPDAKPPVASRLWASSERVYNIPNNTVVSKEPKKAWSAFTETVKEKFVKGTRRQSAEPGEGEGDYLSYRVGEGEIFNRCF